MRKENENLEANPDVNQESAVEAAPISPEDGEKSAEELGREIIDKAVTSVSKTAKKFGGFIKGKFSGLKTSAGKLVSKVIRGTVGSAGKAAAIGIGGTIKGGIKIGRAAQEDVRRTAADVKQGYEATTGAARATYEAGANLADKGKRAAQEDVRRTVADVRQGYEATTGAIAAGKEWVGEKVGDIQDRAAEAYSSLEGSARGAYRDCRDQVAACKQKWEDWKTKMALQKSLEKLKAQREQATAEAEAAYDKMNRARQEAEAAKAKFVSFNNLQAQLRRQESQIEARLGGQPADLEAAA